MVGYKALVIGESRGACAALSPVVSELLARGVSIDLVACGNESERKGFAVDKNNKNLSVFSDLPNKPIASYSFVISGASFCESLEIRTVNNANKNNVPTISVLDQNSRYLARFGADPMNYPNLVALMDKTCLSPIIEVTKDLVPDIESRCFISGWTAFDSYAGMKEKFIKSDSRQKIRSHLNVSSGDKLIVLFSNIFSPNEEYYKRMNVSAEESNLDYFEKVTLYLDAMITLDFFRLQNKGIEVIVAPHPGESSVGSDNYPFLNSRSLAKLWNLRVAEREFYSFEELCMSSDIVLGGPTTAVSSSCMFDIPTLGILYGNFKEKSYMFPAINLGAIPVASSAKEISTYLDLMVNHPDTDELFSGLRRRFSTDGMASKRLVDEIMARYS